MENSVHSIQVFRSSHWCKRKASSETRVNVYRVSSCELCRAKKLENWRTRTQIPNQLGTSLLGYTWRSLNHWRIHSPSYEQNALLTHQYIRNRYGSWICKDPQFTCQILDTFLRSFLFLKKRSDTLNFKELECKTFASDHINELKYLSGRLVVCYQNSKRTRVEVLPEFLMAIWKDSEFRAAAQSLRNITWPAQTFFSDASAVGSTSHPVHHVALRQ